MRPADFRDETSISGALGLGTAAGDLGPGAVVAGIGGIPIASTPPANLQRPQYIAANADIEWTDDPATLTVKEVDGSPSVAATEIDVPNGSGSVAGTVFTMAYAQKINGGRETESVVAASGASQTLNLANGNLFDLTITAATLTLTFSGATSGEVCSFTLWARQDGTGGRLITWPGSVVWPGGITPTLATAINALDEFVFESTDGGTTWLGHHIGAGTALGTATPLVESGVGTAGTATSASHEDHVHPAAAVSTTLAALTDVSLASLADADRLRYSTSDSKWHNSALIWRPVTTWDPTSGLWVPLVDGSGNAIMAEA